ncbi:hypothetical protein Nepgr_014708 [Nepenthes gracilis]|uniref:Uncharacterized protein n=1 Tax=Nepenthes gracilis TaxID=150966 RepID=A0AAD3XPR4_NEPGR|nr:hypothetical protein Nepgr_014708 [Nepenthes gracilis]
MLVLCCQGFSLLLILDGLLGFYGAMMFWLLWRAPANGLQCWTVDPGAWILMMDGTPKWLLIMLAPMLKLLDAAPSSDAVEDGRKVYAEKALGWLDVPFGRNPEAGALLPGFAKAAAAGPCFCISRSPSTKPRCKSTNLARECITTSRLQPRQLQQRKQPRPGFSIKKIQPALSDPKIRAKEVPYISQDKDQRGPKHAHPTRDQHAIIGKAATTSDTPDLPKSPTTGAAKFS